MHHSHDSNWFCVARQIIADIKIIGCILKWRIKIETHGLVFGILSCVFHRQSFQGGVRLLCSTRGQSQRCQEGSKSFFFLLWNMVCTGVVCYKKLVSQRSHWIFGEVGSSTSAVKGCGSDFDCKYCRRGPKNVNFIGKRPLFQLEHSRNILFCVCRF